MDILEVLVDDIADIGIIRNIVCKPQTSGTPVATNLTDDEFSLRFRLDNRLVYLLDGVDVLVIHLFQTRLSICQQGKENGK